MCANYSSQIMCVDVWEVYNCVHVLRKQNKTRTGEDKKEKGDIQLNLFQ